MTDSGGVPTEVHVYVNDRGVMVPRGATALDAVRAHSASEADAIAGGSARLTDSRGLPIEPSAPAHGGLILRVLPVRTTRAGSIDRAESTDADGVPSPDPSLKDA